MARRLVPCAHCGTPADDDQRYCLECGTAVGGESARLLALAAGARPDPASPTPDPTSVASCTQSVHEATLVAAEEAAAPVPLREDRRAITSFVIAAVGVALLMVTGWGPDTAQTLASALPPGLSVTYPGGAAPAALSAATDASTDDVPVDDTVVDDTVVDDTVVEDTPVDDAPVDDAPVDDPPAEEPTDTTPTETTPEEPAPPPIKHVFVVVVPGQDVAAAAQTPDVAPYLAKTLAPKGTILSGYRGVAAGGLANTVALVSGQGPTPEIAAGCPSYADVAPGTIAKDGQEVGAGCAFSVQTGTVGDQLAGLGRTWRAYLPDGPGTGCVNVDTNARQPPAAGVAPSTPPDPFASFHTATDSADCPKLLAGLGDLDADLAAGKKAPAFSYVQAPSAVPAVDPAAPADPDAAPDTGLAAADAWLGAVIPKILQSKAFADAGLLAVTSDATAVNGADDPACCRPKQYPSLKGDGGQGGRVGALLVSSYVAKGKVVDTSFSHFTLLRSIEDLFGLAPLGYAGLKTAGSLVPDVIEPTKP